MALVSAGTDVTIIDESQYGSAATNTIPYILMATASNKLDSAGTAIAPGTLASNTNDVYLVTSQRELVNTFGTPTFYKTTSGNAIHGYELNEYGLMAAYSVLGATNRAYIQRVDIDLSELSASLSRPTGRPNNGAAWLDLVESTSGVFAWNSAKNTFDNANAIAITDEDDLSSGIPSASIGNIGQYAIVVVNANNPAYYKNSNNDWVLLGSDDWKGSLPTLVGTVSNPTLTATDSILINGSATVANTGTTIDTFVTAINSAGILGVTAAKVNNRIEFYVESGTGFADSSVDVTITIANLVGDPLGDMGLTAGTFNAPIVTHASHVQIPRWRNTDVSPRPTGSVWVKTTAVNNGLNLVIKKYNATTDTFDVQDVPAYPNDETANKFLDPAQGGKAIAVGDTYAQYDVLENNTATVKIFERAFGATAITGTTVNPVFTVGHAFTVEASLINNTSLPAPVTVTMTGTTAADFVADLSAAGIAYVQGEVTANGKVKITHTGGGVIVLEDTAGGAIAATGITDSLESVRSNNSGQLVLSNWNVLAYTASVVEPGQDPITGTKWYYPEINEIDIMIHDGGAWKGYRNVTNDIRGLDLSVTDPSGPQVSPLAPDAQSDTSPLVYGDLWVDTSNLEEYPILRRWEAKDGQDQWVTIDNADQTTTDGVLFADARWAVDGITDPVTGDMPLIADMLGSDYLDIDAPDADLYPDGMLLWNTRRSGYNVKEFRQNYFNADDFGTAVLPTETNAWISVSGLREDGSANFGRHAQRSMIVKAMKSAIDTNADIREEQRLFTLLAAPGYPELIPNMVALNNERSNTAHVIGDSPMRLANNGGDITEWATNNDGQGLAAGNGLVSNDEYMSTFYPSGRTTDLTGTSIVVPPSFMMLRTIIHSDEQSYPWLAPAGVRRGGVDNVDGIGYIDSVTGEFKQMSTRQGVRDVLYSNNVNPITFIPGAGIVNYGNKTTKPGSAMDRINVSRLVSYMRVQLDSIGKLFVFEPNDKITRDEIKGQIERMMNDLVAKRAIYDYVVVCDKSNNTPARIDRNELYVDVAIEPVKSAEFIYIPVRLRNTGEISGG